MSIDPQHGSGRSAPVNDPFAQARREQGVMQCPVEGEQITMLLRHGDVKQAAADWQRFSSDAPFRVPIPSEESVRTIRQLPIETDPPEHSEFRTLTEPFFQRAKHPEVIHSVRELIRGVIGELRKRDSFDAVGDLALPIQSRALTHLLNVPESEAETWIQWGIHVFQPVAGEFKSGDALENYLHAQFDRAESAPGSDLFSALTQASYRGRRLTRDECMGFANLVFAGGRDTIIHTVTSIMAYLASSPDGYRFLREDARRIKLASEEFIRVFMPLTQIGRVCPAGASVHGVTVAAGDRVGLCWVSANHDESVFENPDQIQLDRRPNPHVSFGFRTHLCQGAAHARLVIRSLLETLCERDVKIEVLESVPHIERRESFTRSVGYDRLLLRFGDSQHVADEL